MKEKINGACKAKGMTIKDLAEKLEMPQERLCQRLKTGKFSDAELSRISKILEIDMGGE